MTESQLAQPYLRTPTLSPDGRLVAFVYAGDIWLVGIEGGPAERLSAHSAYHFSPCFSPDGSQLAFTSGRSGSGDVYVLPLSGGRVRQLTFHESYYSAEDWSADGQALYVTSGREQNGSAIYRVDLAGGTPIQLYSEPYEQLVHVSASPDGRYLAFANMRDRWSRRGPNPFGPSEVWIGPTAADYAALYKLAGPGESDLNPKLLEPYAGRNCWPIWRPDSQAIYFVSDRGGVENLWMQPLDGGSPRQLTHFDDGRLLWPAIARLAGTIVFERDCKLWRFDIDSGKAVPIDVRLRGDAKYTPMRVENWTRSFSELSLSPDGKKVAFVARGEIFADFSDKETDRDLRQGPSFRVTDTQARESQVVWTPDSRALIYVSDRHGEEELYRYDFAARAELRLTNDLAPKRLPRVSPDGKWVAYIYGQEAVRLLSLDGAVGREVCRARFVTGADLAWSPDGHWLAFIAQDERLFSNVYVVDIAGGEPHQISFLSNLGGDNLLWAPNGRFIIFTSEQYRAEAQIVRVDLRPPAPLFREDEFDKLFEGRDSGFPGLRLNNGGQTPGEPPRHRRVEIELVAPEGGDQPDEVRATPPVEERPERPAESAPETPPPTPEIVFEGIERRLRFLTPTQMNANAEAISPDSRDLLLLAEVAGKQNIWALSLDEPRVEQPPRQLTANESSKAVLQFTPDGRAFFYLDDGQIMVRKFPSGAEPMRLTVRAEINVDFHQEKHQIFGEAWRTLRDSFYDPTFRGQDWSAVRDRFAPLVAGAQTYEELHTIINLMVGELRASHLGRVSIGGMSHDGYTGIIFDPAAQLTSGQLRVLRVLPDSPAALVDEPPRPGEYVQAIDGVALTAQTSLDRLLQRSVGRRVRLRLADAPEHGHSREIALRAVGADAYARLRYRDWVLTNEDYVHQISGGRLGYVHIEEMSYPAYQQFIADLDAEAHGKDGVIVDVRYNGGGHTATFILDVIARRSSLISGFRERSATDAGHLAGNRVLNKPTVLVTNERSYSNTEMFVESYRRFGLGKVVGRPTGGEVIWTNGMRQLDGTWLRLPRFYVMTLEGEDLEGKGRPVDIDVERPLGEWALSRDRQLDAAVAVLIKVIEGH